ncbi:hypothetical protein ADUPG1_007377 [Aduncisulcus paluster]|uniref:Uncharacterized protein n=1 Tax=Aduncisulcus paluster TaxID=2918883 RepID=A0ABQ5KPV4_9EUKA|nr:hypothetical protein ADUPG1_007377 [Aduncisulcus paluster]
MRLQTFLFILFMLFILITDAHSSEMPYYESIPPDHTELTESWSQLDKNAMKGNFHHNTHKMDNLAEHNPEPSVEYREKLFGREDLSLVDNTNDNGNNIGVEDLKLSKCQNNSDINGSTLENVQIARNQVNSSVKDSYDEDEDEGMPISTILKVYLPILVIFGFVWQCFGLATLEDPRILKRWQIPRIYIL